MCSTLSFVFLHNLVYIFFLPEMKCVRIVCMWNNNKGLGYIWLIKEKPNAVEFLDHLQIDWLIDPLFCVLLLTFQPQCFLLIGIRNFWILSFMRVINRFSDISIDLHLFLFFSNQSLAISLLCFSLSDPDVCNIGLFSLSSCERYRTQWESHSSEKSTEDQCC